MSIDPEEQRLRRRYEAAQDWLQPYTVAWGTFGPAGASKPPEWAHSGVLGKLQGRSFLLGAGHSFEDVEVGFPIQMTVKRGLHAFTPRPIGVWHRWDASDEQGHDVGVAELHQHDVDVILAAGKSFYPLERVRPASQVRAAAENAWFWLAGFPGGLYKELQELGFGTRIFSPPLRTACEDTTPSALPEPTTGMRHADLLLSDAVLIASREDYQTELQRLPELCGSSGGGIWDMELSDPDDDWRTEDLSLAGVLVHGGLDHSDDPNRPGLWHYRAASINEHLDLIPPR